MEYEFKGKPFVQNVVYSLVLKLFSGKSVRRRLIAREIKKYHLDNGGIDSGNNSFSMLKKALKQMQKRGMANPTNIFGTWTINPDSKSSEIIIESVKRKLIVEKKIGKGAEFLYVFYFPDSKSLSALNKKNTWACKVGRTEVDVESRILSELGTAHYQLPIVGLIVNTDDCRSMEEFIHSYLTIRKRKIESSVGQEWFESNPEEIESILRSMLPELELGC